MRNRDIADLHLHSCSTCCPWRLQHSGRPKGAAGGRRVGLGASVCASVATSRNVEGCCCALLVDVSSLSQSSAPMTSTRDMNELAAASVSPLRFLCCLTSSTRAPCLLHAHGHAPPAAPPPHHRTQPHTLHSPRLVSSVGLQRLKAEKKKKRIGKKKLTLSPCITTLTDTAKMRIC